MLVKMFDLKVQDENLKKDLNLAFNKMLQHGQFFFGPELEEFEKGVANFIGTKYAIGVASGSSALYLSLKACGIGQGDEVITTPHTWIITINAIAACGAKPVFVDIADDFNINSKLIEKKITKKTKAIVPMHWGGHLCNMEEICKIAKKNNLFIIEDAAQAFGGELNGKKAGSFSIAGAFSMNPMKPLSGYGEGGAVVTNDLGIYEKIKILRYAGTKSDPKKLITNNCVEVSLNHKMDTINAAMLLVSLKYFNKKISFLKAVTEKYNERLNKNVICQKFSKNEIPGRYAFPIIIDKRNELKKYLESKKIETKIWNDPLASEAPVYKQYNLNDTPNANRILNNSLNIPFHEKLTEEQIDYVIDNINNFYKH